MIEWNRIFDPPIGAILFGGISGVINWAVMGYFWVRSREIRLKERMVDKGFSASEIERVMSATTPKSSQSRRRYPVNTHPVGDPG